jgi:hypothetical protein
MMGSKVAKKSTAKSLNASANFASMRAKNEAQEDDYSSSDEIDLFGEAAAFSDSDSEDYVKPARKQPTQLLSGEELKLQSVHAALSANPDFTTKLLHSAAVAAPAVEETHTVLGYVNGRAVVAYGQDVDLKQFDEKTQLMFHEKLDLTKKLGDPNATMFDVVQRHFNSGILRENEADASRQTAYIPSARQFDQAASFAPIEMEVAPKMTRTQQIAALPEAERHPVANAAALQMISASPKILGAPSSQGSIDHAFRMHMEAYKQQAKFSAPIDRIPVRKAAPAASPATKKAPLSFAKALLNGDTFRQKFIVDGKEITATGQFHNKNGQEKYVVSMAIEAHPEQIEVLEFTPTNNPAVPLKHTVLRSMDGVTHKTQAHTAIKALVKECAEISMQA